MQAPDTLYHQVTVQDPQSVVYVDGGPLYHAACATGQTRLIKSPATAEVRILVLLKLLCGKLQSFNQLRPLAPRTGKNIPISRN